jgi:hypothetical protein|tara:strand:+ start:249 stop:515 length:267 start_codon:yes stop_codon:yes gene_type:complete
MKEVDILSNILVQDFFQLVLVVGGILVSIIVYFIKQLLTRINETNALVIQLDKRIAVLVNDTTGYQQRFDSIERRINALEKSVWKKQD